VSKADQFRDLIEAYALGSLDPEDRASVEAHLAAGCAECGKALEESRWLVSQLAYLAPDAQPSDMLRGRLLKTVRADAAKSPAYTSGKSEIPLWMWGAVAAAVLFALYNVYDAQKERAIIADLQKQVAQQLEEQRHEQQQLALAHREAVILTDPRSVKISMPAGSKNLPPLQATWHAALGIVVSGQNLPVPGGTRTLQLWLIPKAPGGKPIPSLAVRPDPDGKFHLLVQNPPDSQGDTKALAITEEPEGGSPQPTTTPIWVGTVAGK
jgi:anti-sigma-K factor RskA